MMGIFVDGTWSGVEVGLGLCLWAAVASPSTSTFKFASAESCHSPCVRLDVL